MNELMIILQGNPVQWIYFKTNHQNVEDALEAFYRRCDSVGINMDNVKILAAVLRNKDEVDIEQYI